MLTVLRLIILFVPALSYRPPTQRAGHKVAPSVAVAIDAAGRPALLQSHPSRDAVATVVGGTAAADAAGGATGGDVKAHADARPQVRRRVKDVARPPMSLVEGLGGAPDQAASTVRTNSATGSATISAASTTAFAPATTSRLAAPDLAEGRQRLLEDVLASNATNLSDHLQLISDAQGATLFAGPLEAAGAEPWMSETTLLGIATRLGWHDGVQVIIKWRLEQVGQGKLDLNAASTPVIGPGCGNNTALHIAVCIGRVDLVTTLLGYGASPHVSNACGETPFETALRAGDKAMVAALLDGSSDLADGFVTLRKRLAKAPQTTWPSGAPKEEERNWTDLVPVGLRPSDRGIEKVGHKPSDWLLHYKCRVMCAMTTNTTRSHDLNSLLSSRGYDSFARTYSISVAMLSVIMMVFFMFVLVISRLKVYGWLQVPVSLAESIPGAFDPARVADPDFDPGKVKSKLPYLTVRGHFDDNLVPRLMQAGSAFWQALFGVFCSWMLQHVRIPPEREPFDEDYLSDDDEECRDRVRRHSVARAKCVQRVEVAIRLVLLVILLQWLLVSAARWDDAYLLVSVMVLYSFCVGCVAGMTVPRRLSEKGAPEQLPQDLDAAHFVYRIFGVQHGPSWVRAITTTRSTASLKPAKTEKVRRPSRQKEEVKQPQVVSKQDDEEPISMETIQALSSGSRSRARDSPSFSDQFVEGFLRSGQMHIHHGELLIGQLVYIGVVSYSMLWLLHLRRWMSGSFAFFYEDRSATDLFGAYGSPGSGFRFLALGLEVLLLGLLTERLYWLCMLLHVSALNVIQRHRALGYLQAQPPLPPPERAADKVAGIREAIARMDEQIRCGDFALELSDLRWRVLRGPSEMLYFFTFVLYVLASVVHLGEDALPFLASLRVDPLVPLCLANCLMFPLLFLLLQATAANRQVQKVRVNLMNCAEEVLSSSASSGENNDVEYVTLRMKSTQALSSSILRWPEGREVRYVDPLLLGIVALAANIFMFV